MQPNTLTMSTTKNQPRVDKKSRILIIVPAFNEARNIRSTVEEILGFDPSLDVVVVNDGSTDDTANVAAMTKARVVNLPFNLGIGGAVQTGIRYAREQNYDIAVQIDGDGQHNPQFLPQILNPVINGEVDVAIGSRFLPPYVGYRSSFVRRIGINFFANLISVLTGSKVTDPTSGFRAFNKKMINVFAQYYPHDFPEPEAIVVARRFGGRVKEFPVEMRKRAHGISSIRYFRTLYYMIKVTLAILLDQLKQRKNI